MKTTKSKLLLCQTNRFLVFHRFLEILEIQSSTCYCTKNKAYIFVKEEGLTMSKKTTSYLLIVWLLLLTNICAQKNDTKDYHPVVEIDAYDNPCEPVLNLKNFGRFATLYIFANGSTSSFTRHSPRVEIDVTRYITLPTTQPLAQINTHAQTVYVYGSGHIKKRKTSPMGELMFGKRAWLLLADGSIKPKFNNRRSRL